MNKINKFLAIFGVFIIALVVGTFYASGDEIPPGTRTEQTVHRQSHDRHRHRPAKEAIEADGAHLNRSRVPSYFGAPPDKESLSRTLDPGAFAGRARAAYAAVREIPETIAQLPCFCYCDESFRHQNLHSCFEDEHGSRCAVCIDEALTAYRLQKEAGFAAERIRERLIVQYAR